MRPKSHYVLSVDVEDYFQVEAFARQISRDDWDHWPSRVVANTHRALDLCDASGAKGTFFLLGWVAQKFPALVREIDARGHELGCHSFWHRPVCSLTREVFREDLRQSCNAIAQASGVRVIGFRAPSWSITAESLWALDILAEEGFVYDSSIFPIHHDLYGYAAGSRFRHRVETASGLELTEFPAATIRLFGLNLPTGGGGYLRILPFSFTKWALRRIEQEDGRAIVVYFHPWELDPDQPRISGSLKSRLRHYTNLGSMESRLRALMATRSFQPFRELLDQPVVQAPFAVTLATVPPAAPAP
jgi:polysaccharide deacetylase family protein (PEP-CTERM system associated)